LTAFVEKESKRWVNVGTGKLEYIEVSEAGKLVQEALTILSMPAPAPASHESERESLRREVIEAIANDCELYAKTHGSNIIVVADDWKPGDPERIEPRDTLFKAAAALRETREALEKVDPELAKVLTDNAAYVPAIRAKVIEECARCVPTHWCDVLLTGPEALKGAFGARAIESLLRGIQDRIRALASPVIPAPAAKTDE